MKHERNALLMDLLQLYEEVDKHIYCHNCNYTVHPEVFYQMSVVDNWVEEIYYPKGIINE